MMFDQFILAASVISLSQANLALSQIQLISQVIVPIIYGL